MNAELQIPEARRRLRWLEVAAAAIVLAFLGAYLARNWSAVAAHDWSFDWSGVLLASAGTALAYSGLVVLWRAVLARLGGSLTIADAHRIWYLSNLARFVPGKVLQLAGTAYLGRAKGVSARASVTAAVTAQIFVLGSGLVVAALGLPAAAPGPARVARFAAALAAALFLAVLLTPAFSWFHRLAVRLAGQAATPSPAVLWRERLLLTVGYTVLWFLLGASFHLFVDAVTGLPPGSVLGVTGVFAAAYLAGYLAVFVPGGLGVREGALAALLSIYLAPPVAVAVAFLARAWSTVVEIVVAAILVARYGVGDFRAGARPTAENAHG